ncbi:outer membrane protein assembly factor BamA [Rhizobium sp. TRM95796]|uniref:outer membrane protein assembly factor BamA n=1 Tax=Rhizobium sp. TRM95796 TaxID=2979862 RepID=UPI0021E83634|nr:outer membrane protein assembly factor BamA [Rhizobium sp. TRM95796]MCV3764121.1 outer membrane protein assembly factor BamA [Rhizobium sp. TRM95796]
MNGSSRFRNAVSVLAITASVLTSTGTMVFVAPTSAEAAVIRNVVVRGADRTGPDAVRAALTIAPGKNFTNADIDASIKKLYATGFFSDVRISVSGGSLVVTVNENQLLNQVVFNGNRKIKDDKLSGMVRSRALGPYSQASIEADIQAIKKAYADIGRSDVEVTTQTAPVGQGRVNLAFVINEGDRTKIADINFTGNTHYGAGRLRSVILTKESGILSFLTRKDIYNEDKLRADEEALRQFYYNHGFADFRVISSNAVLDPATNKYTITFDVDEGERYNFGPINVESTVDGVNAEDLRGLTESAEGKTYRAKDVQDSISKISERVAAAGYPFARVTPRGNRDTVSKTISVDYLVDQGERAYVERIEIRGNTNTRDYVVRREFDLSEGDAFNQQEIAEAKRRLERLGYFQSVNITTQQGSAPDRVVIIVDVVDQSTGSFGIGGGYATGYDGGFIVEASVEEKNFLGRGQYIRVAAGGGASTRNYSLSFTEPYFLGYRLAAGFDLFKTENDYYDNYSYGEQGFSLRVAAPITNDISSQFKYTYREMRYEADDEDIDDLSRPYQRIVNGSPWVTSSVANTITFNTLDSTVLPREGVFASLTNEVAGLGGDSYFHKISAKARNYYTLSDEMDLIGSVAGTAGHVTSLNGGNLHVFDQFMLGSGDIRGFASQGLGPRAYKNDDPLGGTTYFTASAEVTFPLPGVPQDSGFRGGFFMDAGSLWGNDVKVKNSDAQGSAFALRASAGASLIWASPFGPLRVDYAIPFMKEDFDEQQRLKFGISSSF